MCYIGIDIGGTKCSVSLGIRLGLSMSIVDKSQFSTMPNSPDEILQRFVHEINDLLESNHYSRKELKGIGISCGGPLDSRKGIILSPPNLSGWDNICIVDYFSRMFQVKTYLHNDANACAIAEWKFGAGIGYNNLIFITFGTGLGSGMILSGRLYTGTNDMAGEIGHIRLTDDGPDGYNKRGSMEGYCSGSGIKKIGIMMLKEKDEKYKDSRLYLYEHHLDDINAKIIADLADDGDELCKEIYRISGNRLGHGLSILIDIINPEIIIIGSVFTRSYHLLWESARAVIEKETLKRSWDICKIVKSKLGDDVGDYAALSVAMGEF